MHIFRGGTVTWNMLCILLLLNTLLLQSIAVPWYLSSTVEEITSPSSFFKLYHYVPPGGQVWNQFLTHLLSS